MVPPTPTPSNRLVRAAAAERDELRRHRERLLDARESLRAELARIESSLHEVDERDALLDRLTGPAAAEAPDTPAETDTDSGSTLLRGPAIRRTAVEVMIRHPERPEALHYRDWFEALRQAGFAVAGKDPLAVFLTQLSRSPAVRKSSQSGVYELDRSAPTRLRHQLDQLHDELRGLTATPSATADLAAIRARRAELTAQVGQVEKALEEAESVLAAQSTAGRLAATG
jgi:predicted  nucleic acid-binding Zn-ribbon protein